MCKSLTCVIEYAGRSAEDHQLYANIQPETRMLARSGALLAVVFAHLQSGGHGFGARLAQQQHACIRDLLSAKEVARRCLARVR